MPRPRGGDPEYACMNWYRWKCQGWVEEHGEYCEECKANGWDADALPRPDAMPPRGTDPKHICINYYRWGCEGWVERSGQYCERCKAHSWNAEALPRPDDYDSDTDALPRPDDYDSDTDHDKSKDQRKLHAKGSGEDGGRQDGGS